MERDGVGQLSTLYTYGNQRLNSESYNNLTDLYTYDGRGSVSAVIGTYGDFRATYWYDGLGNVKSQIYGYVVFGEGKKYYGYNAESYNPVTGNQNLRNRQLNIRRQRFLTEDTYLGNETDVLSINRYIYTEDNPLKYKDPLGLWSDEYIEELSRQLIASGLANGDRNVNLMEQSSLTRVGVDVITNIAYGISLWYNFINPISEEESYKNKNVDKIDEIKNFDVVPNYTNEITDLLIRESIQYSNARDESYQYQITGTLVGTAFSGIIDNPVGLVIGNLSGSAISRAKRYKYFYQQEKTNGRLDIKQSKMWNDAFNNQIPYPNDKIFKYDDIHINQGDLGNIVYGFWGKVMGFSDKELFYGGGVANSGLFNLAKLLGENFGDKPEYIFAIIKGIELYNAVNGYMYGC